MTGAHIDTFDDLLAPIARQQRPLFAEPCSPDLLPSIDRIRGAYARDRMAFIPGEEMENMLSLLGATDDDFEKLRRVSANLPPDPTLPFRQSRNGRFVIDFEGRTIQRTEFQPFTLAKDEDFVRHDSGQLREFRGIQDDLQLNRAFQGLLRLKAMLIENMAIVGRSRLNWRSRKWISTVFNLRTITTPELLGEPALEGVHSDGVEHTMTTLIGHENMSADSAVTFIHDMAEANGTPNAKANPAYVRAKMQHRRFLDTLLIVDHERKHSLSPVFAVDTTRRATRDMLIFFTRRPTMEGHSTFPYDSMQPHREMPMSVPI